MTVRLHDPQLDNTNKLLYQVLSHALKGEYVLFLCPAGESKAILSRLRMQLSRQRKKLQEQGRRFKQFALHSTVHPETHDGIRHDAIVLWTEQSKYQQAMEEIESILCEGEPANV